MVKLTMIARVSDGLPLAEGLDEHLPSTSDPSSSSSSSSLDLEHHKQQAKRLFKKLSMQTTSGGGNGGGNAIPSRVSYESGEYFMHYVIESGVCYLTLCDRNYPKKLAYSYLEELVGEFSRCHGEHVDSVARPYAFIKFDAFIRKTKKLYSDQRTKRNLEKLNEDLHDIQTIMTRNINEMLGQGERLDHVSTMSGTLAQESKKYAEKAKDLSRQAMVQKYMPLVLFTVLVIVVYLFRRWF